MSNQFVYGYRAQITAWLGTNSLLSISIRSSNEAVEDLEPDFIFYHPSPSKITTIIDDSTNFISTMLNTHKEKCMFLFILTVSPSPPLFFSLFFSPTQTHLSVK